MNFFDRVQSETTRMKAKFGNTCEPREFGDAAAHEANAEDWRCCLSLTGFPQHVAEACKKKYLKVNPGGAMKWSDHKIQECYDDWLED